MKKLFVLALLAMFTLGTQAQIVTSRSTRIEQVPKEKSPKTNFFCVDLGTGIFTGDWEDGDVGIDLGFRWTKMFIEYVGWDIIKANAMTDAGNWDTLNVQFKTGVRGQSPVLFGNARAYANFCAGYALMTYEADSGFTWEVGAGLNLNQHFSVGIAYNGLTYSHEYNHHSPYKDKVDTSLGYLSLRLSYAF